MRFDAGVANGSAMRRVASVSLLKSAHDSVSVRGEKSPAQPPPRRRTRRRRQSCRRRLRIENDNARSDDYERPSDPVSGSGNAPSDALTALLFLMFSKLRYILAREE